MVELSDEVLGSICARNGFQLFMQWIVMLEAMLNSMV